MKFEQIVQLENVFIRYSSLIHVVPKVKRDTMTQFGNRITIFLSLLALFDIGKSITCTAIGDTFQDVAAGTLAHDGEFDMHEGFPCEGWGVSADYSISFDWKMEEMPVTNVEEGDSGWFNILHIGKEKEYSLSIFATHTYTPHP